MDDHRLVREGLALIIDRQADMSVVAAASTGEEALVFYREHRPDITIMDLQLGGMSGVEAIKAIRRDDPQARVIVLTMYQGDEDIYRALEAGAATYLLKDLPSEDLLKAIREVHDGQRPINPDVQARLAERASRPALTPRELQVLQLVSQGLRNREIATALGISEETAQVHVKNILAKLQVNDRTAATAVALRRGIIHLA